MRNLITENEITMIESKIINNFAETKKGLNYAVDSMLKYWEKAKSERLLKTIFGDKLILEKEISLAANKDALNHIIREELLNHRFLNELESKISNHVAWAWRTKEDIKEGQLSTITYHHLRGLSKTSSLRENRIKEDFSFEFNGKKFRFTKGQKVMKAYRQLYPYFGVDEKLFEDFRNAHSLILNDAKITGTLCLSIHPLDYITASDNNSNWESCLSWDGNGCHRAGTLELIECPNTMVVYLKSGSKHYDIGRYNTWNSKKWRQFVMVDESAIVSNKAYPYQNKELTVVALDWIKELLVENCKKEYHEELFQLSEKCPHVAFLQVDTPGGNMYNDTDSWDNDCYFYLNKSIDDPQLRVFVDLGVHAHCHSCGDRLDNYDSEALVCSCCDEIEHCVDCDERIYSDDERYINVDGEVICQYCYENNYFTCEDCGELFHTSFHGCNMISEEEAETVYLHAEEGSVRCDSCHEKLELREDCVEQ